MNCSEKLGKNIKKGIFDFLKPKKHKLIEYELNAMAKLCSNDDVLFSAHKKGENKISYAVIHLTWKGRLEENDDYPRTEFFEDFDHFLNYRMYPDKRDWEE